MTNARDGWNGEYLATEERTADGDVIYKMEDGKYLFLNAGNMQLDSNTDPAQYQALAEPTAPGVFPVVDIWFVAAGGGFEQFADGTITQTCTGIFLSA